MKKSNRKSHRILYTVLGIVIAILVAILGYVAYVFGTYYRIDDHQELTVMNPQPELITAGESHTIATYNIGFGAYGPEFDFFMDYGTMKDGTEVTGTRGTSISSEYTLRNINGTIAELMALDPEIILVQEIDTDSTRSQHINQVEMYESSFSDMASTYAVNFHSAYLFYPFTDPHGTVNAGIMTLSDYMIESAERRSYPVTTDFMKVTDLDRCFAVNRLPVDNGKELVIINSHMSAYDKGGVIREQQWKMVSDVLSEEYAKGNYVILGGDFNHVLGETVADIFPSEQLTPGWLAFITSDQVPPGFRIVTAENYSEVPTCRAAEIPWEKGVNYTCIIDGFIVSDNIDCRSYNIETDFAWTDHQPVLMEFTLL